jgi:CheY-like chemotaxis protein
MTQILVVDDSNTVRLMLRSWLEPEGYEVLEASDGLRALEQIRSTEGPLTVLLDYQMPGLTGYEVLEHALREGRLPPRFGYVIISAMQNEFPPAFTDLLRQLAIQMLPKPFDRATLLAVTAFVVARQDGAVTAAPQTAADA